MSALSRSIIFSIFLKIQRLIVKFLRINISDTLVDLLGKKKSLFLNFCTGLQYIIFHGNNNSFRALEKCFVLAKYRAGK